MRAIITVAGKDRVGIIASVTHTLAERNVNVLDITQTILPPDFFTMVMLVDTGACTVSFGDLADQMAALGKDMGMDIRVQREDIFQRHAPDLRKERLCVMINSI